jgi:hypothetical protein
MPAELERCERHIGQRSRRSDEAETLETLEKIPPP